MKQATKALKSLIAAGYNPNKAIIAVSEAFALTADETMELVWKAKQQRKVA